MKISHTFIWLKGRYHVTETGRIICKIPRDSVRRCRSKIKSFTYKVESGCMKMKNVSDSINSFKAYAANFDSYKTCKSIDDYYKSLFQ